MSLYFFTNLVFSLNFSDKQVVNQIKAQSGSVIRYKKVEHEDVNDENGYFIIGGEKWQLNFVNIYESFLFIYV